MNSRIPLRNSLAVSLRRPSRWADSTASTPSPVATPNAPWSVAGGSPACCSGLSATTVPAAAPPSARGQAAHMCYSLPSSVVKAPGQGL